MIFAKVQYIINPIPKSGLDDMDHEHPVVSCVECVVELLHSIRDPGSHVPSCPAPSKNFSKRVTLIAFIGT